MESIDFKQKVLGKYGLNIIRYATFHFDKVDNHPTWASYDYTHIQYIRTKSLEDMHKLCEAANIKEYEVVEFPDEDPERWYGQEKVIYRTPFSQECYEHQQAYYAYNTQKLNEQKAENQAKLEAIPKRQVLFKFTSGKKPIFVMTYGVNDNSWRGEKVYTQFYFIDSEDTEPDKLRDSTVWLWNYVTKNQRIQKKKLREDLTRWGYSESDITKFIDEMPTFIEKSNQLTRLTV